MRRILALLLVVFIAISSVSANAIEIEDDKNGIWSVFITDQDVNVPAAQDLIAAGVAIDPETAVVTEYETFEEGLVRLSSALAEKMAMLLYTFGPESYMGAYQYEGEEGKFALLSFAPKNALTTLESITSSFMGDIEYDGAVMSLEDMMQE